MKVEISGISFETFTKFVGTHSEDLNQRRYRAHYDGSDRQGTMTISENDTNTKPFAEILEDVSRLMLGEEKESA